MTGVAIRPRPQEVVIRRGTYCSHEGKHTAGMRERESRRMSRSGGIRGGRLLRWLAARAARVPAAERGCVRGRAARRTVAPAISRK